MEDKKEFKLKRQTISDINIKTETEKERIARELHQMTVSRNTYHSFFNPDTLWEEEGNTYDFGNND